MVAVTGCCSSEGAVESLKKVEVTGIKLSVELLSVCHGSGVVPIGGAVNVLFC